MTDRGLGFQPCQRKHSIGAALLLCAAAATGALLGLALIIAVHTAQCRPDHASVRVGGMLLAGCDSGYPRARAQVRP